MSYRVKLRRLSIISKFFLMILCIVLLMTCIINVSFASGDESANNSFEDTISIIDNSNETSKNIDNVLDIPISKTESLRIGMVGTGMVTCSNDETSVKMDNLSISLSDNTDELNLGDIEELKDTVKKEIKEENKRLREIKAKSYSLTTEQGGLIDIAEPDKDYTVKVATMSESDRELLENLVFGEAGGQGFIGQALVAQAIKDAWVTGRYSSMSHLIRSCGYSGSTTRGTSESVKDAVAYIFDDGGYAVKHRVLYFYAPKIVTSNWHETQHFIVEYKGHKFFDRW